MTGARLSDASRKTDVVVVAARYDDHSGAVQSVQAYVRRGSVWGDIVLIDRRTLMDYVKSRRRVMTGSPRDVPGDFQIGTRLRLSPINGTEALTAEGRPSGKDDLGVPLF